MKISVLVFLTCYCGICRDSVHPKKQKKTTTAQLSFSFHSSQCVSHNHTILSRNLINWKPLYPIDVEFTLLAGLTPFPCNSSFHCELVLQWLQTCASPQGFYLPKMSQHIATVENYPPQQQNALFLWGHNLSLNGKKALWVIRK